MQAFEDEGGGMHTSTNVGLHLAVGVGDRTARQVRKQGHNARICRVKGGL